TLSRLSGVPYTTIRRLAQREGQPSTESVLKIIDAVLQKDQKSKFLLQYFPEISGLVNESQFYGESKAPTEKSRYFWSRQPHNFILNLLHNDKGALRSDVE